MSRCYDTDNTSGKAVLYMERCITAFSCRSIEKGQKYSFDDVFEMITADGRAPKLIVFSSDYENFDLYTELLHRHFPDAQVIGTTSFLEHSSSGIGENGLSALAVYDGIECSSGVILEIRRRPAKYLNTIRSAFTRLSAGPQKDICALEFMTAYGKCEEIVLDTFREAIGNRFFPLFGSSAGVRRGTERSFVSLNGKVYDEACVFVFIKNLNGRIAVIKENVFRPTNNFFTVTNVNCEERRLFELDGRPAAVHIASSLGIEIPDLARNIGMHPLGRVYGDNIYIADAESVGKDASISYFSHIYNYSRVVLLEPSDIHKLSENFFEKISATGFRPSFSIAVNCAFDYSIYNDKGITQGFLKELGENCGCFWGVSGCGEQISFNNVSKTMILAAFE